MVCLLCPLFLGCPLLICFKLIFPPIIFFVLTVPCHRQSVLDHFINPRFRKTALRLLKDPCRKAAPRLFIDPIYHRGTESLW